MSMTPGLMFVASHILDPKKLPEDLYNQFYNEEHLPDVLGHQYHSKQACYVAKRYKNTNTASDMAYLALYALEDGSFLASPELPRFVEETRISKTLGNKDIYDFIHFAFRPYEKIQTYEGLHQAKPEPRSIPGAGTHAQTLVCIAMEPAEGQDDDFDAWYRKQHLDMMSMLPHYRRSTRYKRMDGEKPRYLALHEYDCKPDQLPAERSMIVATEWSKKIIDECPTFDRDVFELIQVQGDEKLQL